MEQKRWQDSFLLVLKACIYFLTIYFFMFQSKDTHLTECQFISLMILSNKMEFYKYPITDSFTASLVPHFWTFCCKVTVTQCLLSDTVVQQFRSVYSVVLDRLVASLCHMKNGLQLLISVLKKNLHGNFLSFLYARLETHRIMWLGMAGGRPHRFLHNNFSSVHRIFTKPYLFWGH